MLEIGAKLTNDKTGQSEVELWASGAAMKVGMEGVQPMWAGGHAGEGWGPEVSFYFEYIKTHLTGAPAGSVAAG